MGGIQPALESIKIVCELKYTDKRGFEEKTNVDYSNLLTSTLVLCGMYYGIH